MEATAHLIVMLINIGENNAIMVKGCISQLYEMRGRSKL